MWDDAPDTVRTWGDWFFARALGRELEELGYRVNVLPRCRWYDRSDARYVIVLRGLYRYVPRRMPGRKFLLWNISHPDDVSPDELRTFDHVFFASRRMHERLSGRIGTSSSTLLQCADVMAMSHEGQHRQAFDLLFVGNSRGVERRIVADALRTGLPLSIFGSGWDDAPARDHVIAGHLDRNLVGQAYRNAEIVLNDHWDDMRREGIVSNRIFDVLAAGGFVISDDLPEIGELFGNAVVTYQAADDLAEKARYYLTNPEEREPLMREGQRIVLSSHTFKHRAMAIDAVLKDL